MQGPSFPRTSPNAPVISATHGDVRHQSSPREQARKPAQLMKRWTAALDDVALRDRPKVLAFLSHVTQGVAVDGITATAVINELIACEAYGVFVEAFKAYNAMLATHAAADGKPFSASLTLALPLNWTPSAPAAMHKAFASIEVQHLEVRRPAIEAPIPQAVCDGVATLLLHAGVTALAVNGVLADVDVVVRAMEEGSTLTALELCDAWWVTSTGKECEGYAALLKGARTAARLQHLTIHDAGLLFHLVEGGHVDCQWPSLRSLEVKSIDAAVGPQAQRFLGLVGQSPQLATVSLSFRGVAAESSVEAILGELKRCTALRSLKIQSGGFSQGSTCVFGCFPLAMQLLSACTSLTHVEWDSGIGFPDTGRMLEFFRGLTPAALRGYVEAMEAALKQRDLPVQWFAMTGFPMSQALLEIFFTWLVGNTRLLHLDLSRCCIDIQSTRTLAHALKTNTTLGKTVFSTHPNDYHLTANDGSVHALTRAPRLSYRRDPSGREDVQLAEGPFHEQAAQAFTPDLKEHADTWQNQLLQHQRKVVADAAFPALVTNIARVLPWGFPLDVAGRITTLLEESGALRSAVRISEVHQVVDPKTLALSLPTPSSAQVKALVRLNNAVALARDLPDRPLKINQVDKDGSNKQLVKDVRAGKRMTVSQSLSEGAIDFGGRAQRMAPPGPLRDAFLPMNTVDENGANSRIKDVFEQAQRRMERAFEEGGILMTVAVEKRYLRVLRRWIVKHAIDFGGRVENAAPPGLLRDLLALNARDAAGANKALMAAVRADDAERVRWLRAEGAVDFGRRAWTLAQKSKSAELRGAFAKLAVHRKSKSDSAATVTTTSTTATTTTTGTTTTTTTDTRST
ncbi:hypothetical protein [Hydrogenophaga sp.]|uniref:hypothetical protein n=1 Tax=Hydrogenophaga sp. TaxID=1904254 RepID=UPI002720498E|nr:hypothetical protein [Hydrogenophaga sp.]MDO9434475.1 hypothetical protein [Hydrogenophaga sp.]